MMAGDLCCWQLTLVGKSITNIILHMQVTVQCAFLKVYATRNRSAHKGLPKLQDMQCNAPHCLLFWQARPVDVMQIQSACPVENTVHCAYVQRGYAWSEQLLEFADKAVLLPT